MSAIHGLQLLGTLLVGAALIVQPMPVAIAVGVLGAVALGVALHRNPTIAEPAVDHHFDLKMGLARVSALPIVVRDVQTMASLTGRVGVLILDVHGAQALYDSGDRRGGDALMTTISHRLQGHSWAYPIGGSFGPLFFLEAPSTIVIVRRDVLGDQSNQWLSERLLAAVNEPIAWDGALVEPGVSIGGAIGPVADGPVVVTLASRARRDARTGGPATVAIRQLDRHARPPARPIEVVAMDHTMPTGLLFEMPNPGPRVGIFEHHAGLRRVVADAIKATSGLGVRPLVGTSVTALSHPRAAHDLVERAGSAGAAGRVGLVLPPDFPTNPDHRAADTVRTLHRAGFLILADRRNRADHLCGLPEAPIDLVLVGDDVDGLGSAPLAERRLIAEANERGVALAHARSEAPEASRIAETTGSQGVSPLMPGGSDRLVEGGPVAHLAKAPAISGR